MQLGDGVGVDYICRCGLSSGLSILRSGFVVLLLGKRVEGINMMALTDAAISPSVHLLAPRSPLCVVYGTLSTPHYFLMVVLFCRLG